MGGCVSRRLNVIHPADNNGIHDHEGMEEEGRRHAVPAVLSVEDEYPCRRPYRTIDPNIPDTFHPVAVDTNREEYQCRITRAKISVRKSEKHVREHIEMTLSEWRHGTILGQIENHALSISAENTVSAHALAIHLTASHAKYVSSISSMVKLQIAKAYAIYFWITNNIAFSQNTWRRFINSKSKWKANVERILEKRECLSEGYAALFHSIATAAGLKSCVIEGNIKVSQSESLQHSPQGFECNILNQHWWNMFYIDGVWIPVDCACGSGLIAPHLTYQQKFTRQYFAVNPEHLIFSHLPVAPEWQLLQESVSVKDLSAMISPSVTSLTLGIHPLLWAETINIGHNSTTTTVKIPVNVPNDLKLSVELKHHEQIQSDRHSQIQTTFIQQHDTNEVVIYVSVPSNGRFSFFIYARHNDRNIMCFTYIIYCMTKAAPRRGFPTLYDLPSQAFQFKPLYWNTPQPANSCENDQGKLDLVFLCKPGTKFYHCLLPGMNTSEGLLADACHYCTNISHEVIDESLHKLSVIFPSRGWWTIYLCAARKIGDVEISGYTSLLKFPVYVKKGMHRCSFPYVQSSEIRFQLDEPISCTGTDVLVVPFFSTKDLHFHSSLCFEDIEAHQEKGFTLVETLEGVTELHEYKYALHAVFPKPGKWYIRVFANSVRHSLTDEFLTIFNMLVTVNGCMRNAVFPLIDTIVAKKCSICLLNKDHLIKMNDSMFSLKFSAPKGVKLDHYIEPQCKSDCQDSSNAIINRHCTYLNVTTQTDTINNYELTAIFPKAAQWYVVLCTGESSFSSLKVALQVPVNIDDSSLQVILCSAFPVVHPALTEFGITFPNKYPLYAREIDLPEFAFLFFSSKSISYSWNLKDLRSNKQTPHSSNVYMESISSDDNNTEKMHKLRVIIPKPGLWLVQIVARTVLTDIVADNTLSLSLHYQPVFDLILEAANLSLKNMIFPRLHEPFHSVFGLSIKTTDVPLPSHANQLPTTCTIKFLSPPGVLFWHQCTESSQLQGKKITRMTSDPDTGLHELCAIINKRGRWTIYLHAKHATDTSNNWIAVLQHTIIINARTSKSYSFSSLNTT